MVPTTQERTTGFVSGSLGVDVRMFRQIAPHIGSCNVAAHWWSTQPNTKEANIVRHPKCSARSSLPIAVPASICSPCDSSIARFRSCVREACQARKPSECAVKHATPTRGTDRKVVDEDKKIVNEDCRPRPQSRPMWPLAWNPHIASPSPSYPVRRVRVGLHPCRTRSNTPWCGRALSLPRQ
jgi:hypothetical protein